MGASESRHATLSHSIDQLKEDPSQYPSILQNLLHATEHESLLDAPIPIDNLNTLCNLLRLPAASSTLQQEHLPSNNTNHAPQLPLPPSHERLIFQCILKLLHAKPLYRALHQHFALDLLLQEIDASEHNLYEALVVLWKVVSFNANHQLMHKSHLAHCLHQADFSHLSASLEPHSHNLLYMPFSMRAFDPSFNPVELTPQDKEAESDNKYLFAKYDGFEFLISILKRVRDESYSIPFSMDDSFQYLPQSESSSAAGQFSTEEAIYFIVARIFNAYLIDNSETTSLQILEKLLEVATRNFDSLLELCHHPVHIIRVLYINFILTLFELCKQKTLLQKKFIQSGEVLWQMLFCIAPEEQDHDRSLFDARQQKQLSVALLSAMCQNNTSNIACIGQMLPEPVFAWAFSSSPLDLIRSGCMPSTHSLVQSASSHPPDWERMFQKMAKNYKTPYLIWNFKTRAELREKIQLEIDTILSQRRNQPNLQSWAHVDFFIDYQSLEKHVKVGPYYLTELMKVLKNGTRTTSDHDHKDVVILQDPVAFVDQLQRASVIESNPENMQFLLCVMRTVISQNYSKFREFQHMPYLVWLLRDRCNLLWMEELLLLLKKLFSQKLNIQQFIRFNGVLITINHLKYHLDQQQPSTVDLSSKNRPQEPLSDEDDSTRQPSQAVTPSNHHLLIIHLLAICEAVCAFPRTRLLLSQPPHLQYIVQTLLFHERNVTNQTILLLGHILENNRPLQNTIFKTGIFSFLMLHMNSPGCTQLIAMFLRDYHQTQAHDNSQIGSYLEYFLPKPLILILNKDKGAELFAEAMNTESNLSNLIWSQNHRQKMGDHVRTDLEAFLSSWQQDPAVLYEYKQPEKINYHDLETELCIENIYVRRFVESPTVKVEDKESFLKGLLKRIHIETNNSQHLVLILKAQTILFQEVSIVEDQAHLDDNLSLFQQAFPTFYKYPGFPILFDIIQEVEDLETVVSITTLMITILDQQTEYSKYNKSSFILNQGISKLMRLLQKKFPLHTAHLESSSLHIDLLSSFTGDRHQVEFLASNIMRILTLLASNCDTSVRDHVCKIPLFFLHLTVFALGDSPTLKYHVVRCLREFLSQTTYTDELIRNGIFFFVIALLLDHLDALQSDPQEENQNQEPSTDIELVVILKLFATSEDGSTILQHLLTPNMLHQLRSLPPRDFWTLAKSNIESSSLYWNDSMKKELQQFCRAQIDDLLRQFRKQPKEVTVSLESVYSFRYEALAHEIIINNYYLRTMNSQKQHDDIEHFDQLIEFLFESLRLDAEELLRLIRASGTDSGEESALQLVDGLVTKIHAARLLIQSEKGCKHVLFYLQSCLEVPDQRPCLEMLLKLLSIIRSQFPLAEANSESTSMKHLFAENTVSDLLVIYLHCLQAPGLSSEVSSVIISPLQHILLDESSSCDLIGTTLEVVNTLVSVANVEVEIIHCGMVFLILHLFTSSSHESLRLESARILGTLSSSHQVLSLLEKLLMRKFNRYLLSAQDSPDLLLFYFDEDSETPEIVWNSGLRDDLEKYLNLQIALLRQHFEAHFSQELPRMKSYNWNGDLSNYSRPHLDQEMQIGGIFVRTFVEHPTYKLKKIDTFLTALFQTLQSKYSIAANQEQVDDSLLSTVELVWQAVYHLFKSHLLRLQQASLKYIGFMMYHFDHRLSRVSIASNCSVLDTLYTLSGTELAVTQIFAEQPLSLGVLLGLLVRKPQGMPDHQTIYHTDLSQSNLTPQLYCESLILRILSQLVERNALIVKTLFNAGAVYYIVYLLLLRGSEYPDISNACVDLLMGLCSDADYGNEIGQEICELTTSRFLLKLESSSSEFIEFFFGSHTASQREWNEETRDKLKEHLEKQIAKLESTEWDGMSKRTKELLS